MIFYHFPKQQNFGQYFHFRNVATWYTARLRSKDSKLSSGWPNTFKSHLHSKMITTCRSDAAKLYYMEPSLAFNRAFSSSSQIDLIIQVDKAASGIVSGRPKTLYPCGFSSSFYPARGIFLVSLLSVASLKLALPWSFPLQVLSSSLHL